MLWPWRRPYELSTQRVTVDVEERLDARLDGLRWSGPNTMDGFLLDLSQHLGVPISREPMNLGPVRSGYLLVFKTPEVILIHRDDVSQAEADHAAGHELTHWLLGEYTEHRCRPDTDNDLIGAACRTDFSTPRESRAETGAYYLEQLIRSRRRGLPPAATETDARWRETFSLHDRPQ